MIFPLILLYKFDVFANLMFSLWVFFPSFLLDLLVGSLVVNLESVEEEHVFFHSHHYYHFMDIHMDLADLADLPKEHGVFVFDLGLVQRDQVLLAKAEDLVACNLVPFYIRKKCRTQTLQQPLQGLLSCQVFYCRVLQENTQALRNYFGSGTTPNPFTVFC